MRGRASRGQRVVSATSVADLAASPCPLQMRENNKYVRILQTEF